MKDKMKKKESKSNKRKAKSTAKQDERFSKIAIDPLFNEIPRKERKVVVDERFQRMLKDDRFKIGASVGKVDKRGRKIDLSTNQHLANLYDFEQSDEDSHSSVSSEQKEADEFKIKIDLARGEGNLSSSSEDESEEDEGSPDENPNLQQEAAAWSEMDRSVTRVEWASRRIAVCNLDWDRLRADDLMIVLNSFKPATGSILSVGVFLSDFGAERLEEEERNGPALPKLNEDDDDMKSDEKGKEMIRAYQLERLRYFYAVCECDSEDTAIAIYEGCDGVEYETSGVRFDLRFIPNEMEFDENRLRERVTTDNVDVEKYKPKRFESLALSNCNTKLTWDENDPERTLCVTEAFKEETLDKFDNLIAPPSDSDDEDSTNRLQALLTEETVNTGRTEDNESLRVEWKSLKGSEEVDQTDDPLNKDTQKKEKKGRTPFQEYLERRKQKRKERKEKLAEMKKERKIEIQEETKTGATGKRQKVITKGDSDTVDLGDGRFAALFTDSAYAIDKTHSKFRGGNLADKQVQEKRKRISTTDTNKKCRQTKGQTLNADSAAEESAPESTTTLVEKLKKKAKKLGSAV
ncbi:hypothetical protein Ddc_05320 [Ditylenchus destructor]|nr:hypothetical protein Ddc_05320 [Ditylenchus destructor]